MMEVVVNATIGVGTFSDYEALIAQINDAINDYEVESLKVTVLKETEIAE